MLSEAKHLDLPLRINSAKNLSSLSGRPFTEFTLSVQARSFVPLRMTSEGLRMTSEGLRMTSEGLRMTDEGLRVT